MWNGTMFVDLDWPLNASSLLSASAELLVLLIKIGNLMKAAYSTSCFSNDSDYYRGVVKWKQLKEHRLLNWSRLIRWYVSETVTVSDNWFVFNVDSVYYTAFLCISDRNCSLLHTCSVCFVIIKNCFVVAASYPFFVGVWCGVTHFYRAWG